MNGRDDADTSLGDIAESLGGTGPQLDRPLDGFSASELLATTPNAVFIVDENWRFTYIDEMGETLLARNSEALIGRNLWEAFPEAIGTTFEREYREAVKTNQPRKFVEFYPPLGAWFSVQAIPRDGSLFAFFYDVTDIKEAEERASRIAATHEVMRKVATAVAESDEPDAVYRLICSETATLLNASGTWILELDKEVTVARILAATAIQSDTYTFDSSRPLAVAPDSALVKLRDSEGPVPGIESIADELPGSNPETGIVVPVRAVG